MSLHAALTRDDATAVLCVLTGYALPCNSGRHPLMDRPTEWIEHPFNEH